MDRHDSIWIVSSRIRPHPTVPAEYTPALTALGTTRVRPHDFRRTFIALHVEARTHPKLVQERVGHSNIGLTMDTYGKIAGRMTLAQEQEVRFEVLAARPPSPYLFRSNRPQIPARKLPLSPTAHSPKLPIPKVPADEINTFRSVCVGLHIFVCRGRVLPGESMRTIPIRQATLCHDREANGRPGHPQRTLLGLPLQLRCCSVVDSDPTSGVRSWPVHLPRDARWRRPDGGRSGTALRAGVEPATRRVRRQGRRSEIAECHALTAARGPRRSPQPLDVSLNL